MVLSVQGHVPTKNKNYNTYIHTIWKCLVEYKYFSLHFEYQFYNLYIILISK